MDGTPVRKQGRRFPEWAKTTIITISVIVIVLALALIAGAILLLGFSGSGSKDFTGESYPYIAKIKVAGVIEGASNIYYSSDGAYHHAWTLRTIDTLIDDENNRGIYLWLDTPGGTVYESDELYLKLMEYKEKTGRPVYTYMSKIATSGGYYIAAASDEILANRNTWTGSIGVTLGTFFDMTGFLEEHGIKTETITSGRNKAMGSSYVPMTGEQKRIYQSLVDGAYEQFLAIVAEGRGMDEKDVRILADGRIYTAAQALEAGLIDVIAGEKEAEELIKEKFEEEVSIVYCYYEADRSYLSFLGLRLSRDGAGDLYSDSGSTAPDSGYEGDVAAVLDFLREHEEAGAPPLWYLYTG